MSLRSEDALLTFLPARSPARLHGDLPQHRQTPDPKPSGSSGCLSHFLGGFIENSLAGIEEKEQSPDASSLLPEWVRERTAQDTTTLSSNQVYSYYFSDC